MRDVGYLCRPTNLVFLGLSVLDLGPMYATDRQIDVRQTSDIRQKHRMFILLDSNHHDD